MKAVGYIFRAALLFLVLFCIGCTGSDSRFDDRGTSPWYGPEDGTDTPGDGEDADPDDSTEIVVPQTPDDEQDEDDSGGQYDDIVDASDDDFVENSSFENRIEITFEGNSASVSGEVSGVTVDVQGANVTVSSAVRGVDYVLRGATASGSFKVYSDYKLRLTLDGVSIASADGPAVNIQSGKRVYVVLSQSTSSCLSDLENYTAFGNEDMKGCFFSEGQLIFSGSGALTVTGNYKHAICSDDYIRLRPGVRLTVAGSVKDGIHVNDYFVMSGGDVNIKSSSDGIECDKGYIDISGGDLCIDSADDGIAASYEGTDMERYVNISGGTVQINTSQSKGMGIKSEGAISVSGGDIAISVAGDASKCMKSGGTVDISGGKMTLVTSGSAVYQNSDMSSCAAIKSSGVLTVSGGTINATSSGAGGKGISADADIHIQNGTIVVNTTGRQFVSNRQTSSSKGIKSDNDIIIDGGNIYVIASGSDGSEGIESKNVLTINDGSVEVNAYDDAINASKSIVIAGGRVFCYSSGNDGMDSNGTLTISGGITIASGTSSPEDGFDCDNNTFKITGGILIGTGGGSSTPTSSACTQSTLLWNASSIASGSVVGINDASGGTILMYKIPRQYSNMTLLFSSPDLKQNSTYTIYNGGTVSGSGTEWHGYYYDGYDYSAGSQSAQFTQTSMITTVGNSGGGGGGGGRPGRW